MFKTQLYEKMKLTEISNILNILKPSNEWSFQGGGLFLEAVDMLNYACKVFGS